MVGFDRFEQREIKSGKSIGTEAIYFGDGVVQIEAQSFYIHTPAMVGPILKPLQAATVNLERPVIILTRNVKVGDCGLQNALIQISHPAGFSAPCGFKFLVRFKIPALIEEQNPFTGAWMKFAIAFGNHRGSIT